VTGWNFARNGDAKPVYQYCYLELSTRVSKERYDIESRPGIGRQKRPDVLIPGMDDAVWSEAATKCRWHG
jgi:hypothetical protein